MATTLARWSKVLVPFAALLTACAPRAPEQSESADAAAYLDARNAVIRRALEAEDPVGQINMQELSLEVALDYLANHLDVPMQVDWEALERQGIRRAETTTTINLFDANYADGLNAALWLLRPKTGSVRTRVFLGKLLVLPLSDQPPPPETAAQLRANARILAVFKERFDPGETRGVARPADTLFYFAGFSKRMSMIVDWDELAKLGVDRKTAVTVALEMPTTEEYLKAVIDRLKAPPGTIAVDVRAGMVRVSTKARLDAEHAAAGGSPATAPAPATGPATKMP